MISTRRKLVEPDVDTGEAPVSEDVRRWPDAAGIGSPLRTKSVARPSPSNRRSPRYPHRSSSSAGQCGRTTGLSRPPLRTELEGLVDDKLNFNIYDNKVWLVVNGFNSYLVVNGINPYLK